MKLMFGLQADAAEARNSSRLWVQASQLHLFLHMKSSLQRLTFDWPSDVRWSLILNAPIKMRAASSSNPTFSPLIFLYSQSNSILSIASRITFCVEYRGVLVVEYFRIINVEFLQMRSSGVNKRPKCNYRLWISCECGKIVVLVHKVNHGLTAHFLPQQVWWSYWIWGSNLGLKAAMMTQFRTLIKPDI